MGYELTFIPEDSILLTTFHDDFSVAADAPKLMEEMKSYLDGSTGPVYMLDDCRQLKMSFADLVAALALATRGDVAIARHPNVYKLVLVSTSELLRMGGNALKQAQYGGIKTDIYRSLDEALAGIRQEMAAAAHA